jgi:uncharacterized protein YggU (UPF0235/DUF167 family)
MIGRKFKFSNGGKGSALAIRVSRDQDQLGFGDVLSDGTVVINIPPEVQDIDLALMNFLAGVLDVAAKRLDVIAGGEANERLISILDMEPEQVQSIVLKNISG